MMHSPSSVTSLCVNPLMVALHVTLAVIILRILAHLNDRVP